MSEGIKYGATNQDEPEETLFSFTPVQSIRLIIDYWTKSYQFLYEYATSNLNKELYDFTPG